MIEPAFEIRYGQEGERIEIFADGRITGLPVELFGIPVIIVNRIPQLLAEAYSAGVHRQ